jgi:hypothetical protein
MMGTDSGDANHADKRPIRLQITVQPSMRPLTVHTDALFLDECMLALRRVALSKWNTKDMEWSQLVEEFSGYKNRELGEHAWRDLHGLLHCEF